MALDLSHCIELGLPETEPVSAVAARCDNRSSFWTLQKVHNAWRFHESFVPLRARGMMWSTSSARSCELMPHASQRPMARLSTL